MFPAEQVALFNAAQQGDWEKAKQIMSEIYPAIHSMESGNYNQKAKAGCLKGSMDVGSVRVPLTNMLDDEKAAFLALLSK